MYFEIRKVGLRQGRYDWDRNEITKGRINIKGVVRFRNDKLKEINYNA